jgi:hypothetical protein
MLYIEVKNCFQYLKGRAILQIGSQVGCQVFSSSFKGDTGDSCQENAF